MKHGFVWKIPATEPVEAQATVWDALERAMTFDLHLSHAKVEARDGHILVRFQYQGRDRWWINKRARYAVIALAVRAKLPPKNVELLEVQRIDTGHDLKKPNRTEAQQAADFAKTSRGRWARMQATSSSDQGH